eukprot:161982_1
MADNVFIVLFFTAINAQYAPHRGSISCDTSLIDWFPPGSEYTNYYRYYTFTAAYPTLISRDVRISTCTEDSHDTIATTFYGYASLRDTTDPTTLIYDTYSLNDCEVDEIGYSYYFRDLPEGDWEIGINNNEPLGGKYKLSVECIQPSTPTPDLLKNTNVTQPFPYRNDFIRQGSKKISCDVNAFGTIVIGDDTDWYEFTITK